MDHPFQNPASVRIQAISQIARLRSLMAMHASVAPEISVVPHRRRRKAAGRAAASFCYHPRDDEVILGGASA